MPRKDTDGSVDPGLALLERIAVAVEFLVADKRASMARSGFCLPGEESEAKLELEQEKESASE